MNEEVIVSKREDGRITVSVPYNPEYIAKLKKIKGYRWHPESKLWSFPSDNSTLNEILELFDKKDVNVPWPLEHGNSLETIPDSTIVFLTIKEAAVWASNYVGKNVTSSNISYLVQYGRIKKISHNGTTFVRKDDLIKYYQSFRGKRELEWKEQLGDDLNWALSFDYLREADTTKHVHRLHPYKGKFIPQLVEYFLDDHIDDFKKEVYFKKGDIVLDPFCGSGTTLVQANELGINAIGIDVSIFNSLISNVKISKYDFGILKLEISRITETLRNFISKSNEIQFEQKLSEAMTKFNNLYFPSPEYKYKLHRNEINESVYGSEKEAEFLPVFNSLVREFRIQLKQGNNGTFLDKWYLQPVRREIDFTYELINNIQNNTIKDVLMVILSRTIRSCRATTHEDLATLIDPISSPYYCAKHKKICKPLFSILSWWERYSTDTIERLEQFNKVRTNTFQFCLTGDSRTLDIPNSLNRDAPELAELVQNQKIKGIFSSPPYIGLINYHEQHSYAYELFDLPENTASEIGNMSLGQGREARNKYVIDISNVLINCKQYLVDDYDVFLVANDKFNLYPSIANKADMNIVEQFKRPVLNRTEKDKGAYSEVIFHLKKG
ncbi:type II DNA modification methyltransferase [Ferroplasma acidiphilum]|uniref:Type II DNA modification methyltransferase n=1 Tax=Ferroplasma acidiphilum TaxID=74969 RepID=A0A1V0N2B3_9ARCH|nr:DNA methyltransferase [Ferroplasma acidiphilum]ARD84234.1 type II DNA modification methyltransferase [Ferroplasma acidiphilum]